MDVYTLTENFLPKDFVDQFASAIWTERYSSSGDAQLVLGASEENIEKLKPGTYLALRGSDEVQEIHSQNIEDGLLTVNGTTLDQAILNQRYFWQRNMIDPSVGVRISDYVETTTPGQLISDSVYNMVISPTAFPSDYGESNLDWMMEIIPQLSLGDVDNSGTPERLTMSIGPLYEVISQIAEKYGVGISLYLDSADPLLGFSLKFKTYRGLDRTSDQTINPMVRLMPDMDSLSEFKEINSNAMYKNVCYVYYQGVMSIHYADPDAPIPEGLARRILITNPEKNPVGHKETAYHWYGPNVQQVAYDYYVVGPDDLAAFREQNARDALANHNYIHAIDGQTSPDNQYKFGVDYGLGDIIELQGLTGNLSKVRVTEFIRSQDQFGERNYPTISVINEE